MCGIAGFWTLHPWMPLTKIVTLMTDALAHRGPNDAWVHEFTQGAFGQRRLSIIDLSEWWHQPMWYQQQVGARSERFRPELANDPRAHEAISIVFNGEIYNFQEIRTTLQAAGYTFATQSDTEVILASYLHRWVACFSQFNGMWACVIHDPRTHEIIISRDIVGKKPLYYYHDAHTFAFASELKAFVALDNAWFLPTLQVDTASVEDYFAFGYIPAPQSIYSQLKKLPPRSYMRLDLKTMQIKEQQEFFTLPDYTPVHDRNGLVQQGKDILADAVRLRMIADVPVGTFLSGWLDSSAVTAQMRTLQPEWELHTFSIGFAGKAYDESAYIHVAQQHIGTVHHHAYFTQEDFDRLLPQFAFSYDEPFWDFSGFPTHQVCALAKPFVTVVLSGDGGDEIFGGYNSHLAGRRLDLLYHVPALVRKLIARIPARPNLKSFINPYLLIQACKLSLFPKNQFYVRALADEMLKTEHFKQLTTEWLTYSLHKWGGSLAEALRIYDLLFNTLDNNFLVKVDRASMANAIEVRSPFLDKRFLTFAQTIPTAYKLSIFQTKKLMRAIIADLLPREIVQRGKQGFLPPIGEWIRQPQYRDALQRGKALITQYAPQLSWFYDTCLQQSSNTLNTTYIIKLFLFALWHEKWRK